MADIPHVIILGGGFGGIGALKKLRDADVRITWDPPWNQSMISEEGKMKLGLV